MHQLWQAVILKPFKLEECILYFWKPPIFNNLVLAGQDHTYVLNTQKAFPKIATYITVYLLGVNSQTHMTVKGNWNKVSFLDSIIVETTCLQIE